MYLPTVLFTPNLSISGKCFCNTKLPIHFFHFGDVALVPIIPERLSMMAICFWKTVKTVETLNLVNFL
jgi:hypothetical protein